MNGVTEQLGVSELASGTYRLVAAAEGAETQSHDIEVVADVETPFDLNL